MSAPGPKRSKLGRPYRRMRRWARHTPNGTIAVNLIAIGVAFVLIALIVAIVAL